MISGGSGLCRGGFGYMGLVGRLEYLEIVGCVGAGWGISGYVLGI